MAIAFVIYLILLGISAFLIQKKKAKSIIYLPLFFITYEILKNIFIEFGIETGLNGFQNLNVFLFILPHLKRVFKKGSTLFIVIFFFLIYYFFRIPYSEDLISLLVQSLGLFNIYTLILVGVTFNIKKYRDVFYGLNKSYLILLIIYCSYIIVASLLKFGPNHYDTGIIYGLRFEQYYSAALVIILFPVMQKYLQKKDVNKYKIFSIIGIIIIILTLRRTTYVILLLGFLLYPFSADRKTFFTWVKRNSYIVIGALLVGILIFIYTDIFSFRSYQYSADYDIEEEGRFLELNLVLLTLEQENSYLFGIGKFLKEEGNYNFFKPDRALHGPISKFLLGGGIFGLILFYFMFSYIGWSIKNFYRHKRYVHYKAMGLTLVVIYLLVSLTGAIGVGTGVSFTGSLFLYLGFLVNILKNSSRKDLSIEGISASNLKTDV